MRNVDFDDPFVKNAVELVWAQRMEELMRAAVATSRRNNSSTPSSLSDAVKSGWYDSPVVAYMEEFMKAFIGFGDGLLGFTKWLRDVTGNKVPGLESNPAYRNGCVVGLIVGLLGVGRDAIVGLSRAPKLVSYLMKTNLTQIAFDVGHLLGSTIAALRSLPVHLPAWFMDELRRSFRLARYRPVSAEELAAMRVVLGDRVTGESVILEYHPEYPPLITGSPPRLALAGPSRRRLALPGQPSRPALPGQAPVPAYPVPYFHKYGPEFGIGRAVDKNALVLSAHGAYSEELFQDFIVPPGITIVEFMPERYLMRIEMGKQIDSGLPMTGTPKAFKTGKIRERLLLPFPEYIKGPRTMTVDRPTLLSQKVSELWAGGYRGQICLSCCNQILYKDVKLKKSAMKELIERGGGVIPVTYSGGGGPRSEIYPYEFYEEPQEGWPSPAVFLTPPPKGQ